MHVRSPYALVLPVALLCALACSSGGAKKSSGNSAGTVPAQQPVASTAATAPARQSPASGQAASTPAPAAGATIDGIPCETSERLTYHVHAHLTLLSGGQPVTLPAQIGVNDNTCIYWLHTHDTTGIIHIEAPAQRPFVLGEFFDIWRQPLSSTQVASLTADGSHSLQFFVDGKPYTGDPRQIPLANHELITIEYGPPFPTPPPYTFPAGY